jgi:hypothetical protein
MLRHCKRILRLQWEPILQRLLLLTVTWLIHNNRAVLQAEQACLVVRECPEEAWDQVAAEDPAVDEVKTVADQVAEAIEVTADQVADQVAADQVAEVDLAEETEVLVVAVLAVAVLAVAVLAVAVLAVDLGQGAVPAVDLALVEEVKEVAVKEVEVEDAWVLLLLKAS